MQNHKISYVALILGLLFFLAACRSQTLSTNEKGYRYRGIYFGIHPTPLFRKGIRDGCETARGDYRKFHHLFNNSIDYNSGWFLGRNRCRGLLKIDEDDNLIL